VPPVEPPVETRVKLLPYVAAVVVIVIADWAALFTVTVLVVEALLKLTVSVGVNVAVIVALPPPATVNVELEIEITPVLLEP
jgi:hypothetical protein